MHINNSVKARAQKAHRIPFHVRPEFDKELNRLLKLDIIEKVTNELTPWVSQTDCYLQKAWCSKMLGQQ